MKPTINNLLPKWLYFWGEARTRIVIWYVVIVLIAIGGAIPIMRQQMLAQVDTRVRADLNQEMQEFVELLSTWPRLEDTDIVRGLQEDGKVIPTVKLSDHLNAATSPGLQVVFAKKIVKSV